MRSANFFKKRNFQMDIPQQISSKSTKHECEDVQESMEKFKNGSSIQNSICTDVHLENPAGESNCDDVNELSQSDDDDTNDVWVSSEDIFTAVSSPYYQSAAEDEEELNGMKSKTFPTSDYVKISQCLRNALFQAVSSLESNLTFCFFCFNRTKHKLGSQYGLPR